MSISYIVLLTAFYVDNGPRLPLWQLLPPVAFWVGLACMGVPLLVRSLRRHGRRSRVAPGRPDTLRRLLWQSSFHNQRVALGHDGKQAAVRPAEHACRTNRRAPAAVHVWAYDPSCCGSKPCCDTAQPARPSVRLYRRLLVPSNTLGSPCCPAGNGSSIWTQGRNALDGGCEHAVGLGQSRASSPHGAQAPRAPSKFSGQL